MTRARCLSALTGVFTMAVALLVAPSASGAGTADTAAAATSFTSTGVNQNGGNCLDVPGSSTTSGTQLRANTCNAGGSQSFGFTPVAGATDTYTISTPASGQCVDVYGGSAEDNATIIQWSCHGETNQQWRLVPVSAGGADKTFNLVSVASGKCIAPSGGSTASDTGLVQLACS
ncbi:RICIN domain-containing protein, partial [Streptomyces sp. MCAF7]